MIEPSTETAGMSIPPIPIERMNGSGSTTMLSRPIATVEPETITARPACHRLDQRRLDLLTVASSSRKRKIISSE